jgi:LemA protein
MTTTQFTAATATAVLVFWIVGAYNRLVRLRSALVARFASVDQLYGLRHGLLAEQIDLLAGALASAAPRLDALRAACLQADAAREHARLRPGAPGTVSSLRLADEILADARSRLPVQTVAGADLPALNARLTASDTTLAFARREFNAAVAGYNAAVRQFPTVLVAWAFGFRPAATF